MARCLGGMRWWLALLVLIAGAAVAEFDPPPVMRAGVYSGDVPLADYWVSEKLDGVRGYWDGHKLLTRGGNRVPAPAWFTAGWPAVPLDGELWLGRGEFERASGIVRRQQADDAEWRAMRFMVFDLPAHGGSFDQRLPALQALLAKLAVPWVQPVAQFRVADAEALQARLDAVVAAGGEGLMLHRGSGRYRAARTDDLLKLKPLDDAEARVVEYLPGTGKYEGQLGALLVERPDGLRFRIGTGFSDAQRREPPPLGSWVTYGYSGLTAGGVPRFARFLRLRDDLAPE